LWLLQRSCQAYLQGDGVQAYLTDLQLRKCSLYAFYSFPSPAPAKAKIKFYLSAIKPYCGRLDYIFLVLKEKTRTACSSQVIISCGLLYIFRLALKFPFFTDGETACSCVPGLAVVFFAGADSTLNRIWGLEMLD
jgi:hypothetical protein